MSPATGSVLVAAALVLGLVSAGARRLGLVTPLTVVGSLTDLLAPVTMEGALVRGPSDETPACKDVPALMAALSTFVVKTETAP